MAIYHLSVKAVKRSAGRSATAAAAYRSGEVIADSRTGECHDYRRRSGVIHRELVGWSGTRAELWNAAEAAERRKDACTGREYEVALPCELTQQDQERLATEFGQWLHAHHGIAVDICIHRGHTDPRNTHAHILTTTRKVAPGNKALQDKAAVEWSDKRRKDNGLPGRKTELEEARVTWEKMANAALGRAQVAARVDHRSYADQGVDRAPQPKLGPAATRMENRGERSERGDAVRQTQQHNARVAKLAETQAQVRELQEARKRKPLAPNTFRIDVGQLLEKRRQHEQRIRDRIRELKRYASHPEIDRHEAATRAADAVSGGAYSGTRRALQDARLEASRRKREVAEALHQYKAVPIWRVFAGLRAGREFREAASVQRSAERCAVRAHQDHEYVLNWLRQPTYHNEVKRRVTDAMEKEGQRARAIEQLPEERQQLKDVRAVVKALEYVTRDTDTITVTTKSPAEALELATEQAMHEYEHHIQRRQAQRHGPDEPELELEL